MIDNSDSKPSEFGRWFTNDYIFLVKIVSSILILISFWYFSIEFDHFFDFKIKQITLMSIIRSKKLIEILKKSNSIKDVNTYQLFWFF